MPSISQIETPTTLPVETDPIALSKEKAKAFAVKPTVEIASSHGDWRDDLFNHGFAVVTDAVPQERCDYYIQSMYNWLEKFPFGFKKNDKSTWTPENLPANMKGGMYHAYRVQHEKFVWEARMEPGVLSAFSKLWGTDKLLASFDGINFTLPTASRTPWEPWPHIDQSPHRLGLQCVQGIINFSENGPKDGGLTVLKDSHKFTEEYFSCHDTEQVTWNTGGDWHGFSPEDISWFKNKGCKEIKVCCGPGDLLIWDSRTIHYNVCPEGDQTRALVYACYAPAKFAKKGTLEKKAKFFEERRGTTHWPHDNIFLSVYSPPTRLGKEDSYNRDCPFAEPEISDQLLRLAGVLPYDEQNS
ncbi:MAG: hypothetical protein M1834_004730 [Cirrosporium novae-zelandiae]|nr:MAG: hypothetical protein M1834_004730 [Cirrosporium novae-zelandiae]